MRFETLEAQIDWPVFSIDQASRAFSPSPDQLRTQLKRWVDRGKLRRLKRGLYQFPKRPVEEFTLGAWLYQPSYVSLESALNNYGIMPDVPMMTTLVTPTTSKQLSANGQTFRYVRLDRRLFWGYLPHPDVYDHRLSYPMAEPEKALLDWIYCRRIGTLAEARIDLENLDRAKLIDWSQYYPKWVRRGIEL